MWMFPFQISLLFVDALEEFANDMDKRVLQLGYKWNGNNTTATMAAL